MVHRMAVDPSVTIYSQNGWLVYRPISATIGLFKVKSPDIADSEWQNMVKRNTREIEEPRENITTLFSNTWGWYTTNWYNLYFFFCTSSIINFFNEAPGTGSPFCFHLKAMGPPAGAFLVWRQKQNRLPERRASLQNYTMDKLQKRWCQGFFFILHSPLCPTTDTIDIIEFLFLMS